jgi:hypothetical protein
MRRFSFGLLVLGLSCCAALAQSGKGIRFWNLTANTVKEFYLSPAGKDEWGPDQCKNDKDGEVDHRERLSMAGIGAGRYDARLVDAKGRTCIVRNIEIKDAAVFSIEEKQLKNKCSKKGQGSGS